MVHSNNYRMLGPFGGLYRRLLAIPSFGPFLAFQYAVDLNYTPHFDFDEMDFVVAGPGAIRGIAKCFEDTGGLGPEEVVAAMAASAGVFLANRSRPFQDLDGRPLQLIDCQNLFCEVDKYARVRHPARSNERSQAGEAEIRARPPPHGLGVSPQVGPPLEGRRADVAFLNGATCLIRPCSHKIRLRFSNM